MEIEELLQVVDVAFQCPDAKDIEDSEKEEKPNGARSLGKHKAQALLSETISEVIYNACHDSYTADGPAGGYANDPRRLLSDPLEFDRSAVHDEQTLAREIQRNDGKY